MQFNMGQILDGCTAGAASARSETAVKNQAVFSGSSQITQYQGEPEIGAVSGLSADILLRAAQGNTDAEIATSLAVAPELAADVVRKFVRSRFVSLEQKLLPPAASGSEVDSTYWDMGGLAPTNEVF